MKIPFTARLVVSMPNAKSPLINIVLFAVLFTALLLCSSALASRYQLPESADGINLKEYVSFAYSEEQTPDGLMVTSPVFKKLTEKAFTVSSSKLWYSLELYNRLNVEDRNNIKETNWYIYTELPNVPLLRVYILDTNEKWQLIYDDSKSFSKRPVQAPIITLPFKVSSKQPLKILMEYKGFQNMPLSFKLYDEKHLQPLFTQHVMFNSMLIGFCILIGLLSLCYMLMSGDWKAFTIFILSLAAALYTSETAGFNFQYLWPNNSTINHYMPVLLQMSLFMCFLFYTTQIFRLKKNNAHLARLFFLVIILLPITSIFGIYSSSLELVITLTIISNILIVSTCIWAVKKQLLAAKLFLVGALYNMVFSNLIVALSLAGVITLDSMATLDFAKTGFIFELFIFAVVIIYRTKLLQSHFLQVEKDKIKSEKKTHLAEIETQHLKAQNVLSQEKIKYQTFKAEINAELLNDKNKLFADISHELSTPLTVIKLQVEALQDELEDDVQSSYLVLQDKLSDLDRIICDVSVLSQPEIASTGLNLKEVNVSKLLDTWSYEFKLLIHGNDLQWQFQNSVPNTSVFTIDSSRIKQVLNNILSNSVKYTHKPGKVILSSSVIDANLVITIEDSYPSVPTEQQMKIFERLYRVEPSRSRSTGGSGLGLAICKNLIEAHHGEIYAGSSTLNGLKLTIKIPID